MCQAVYVSVVREDGLLEGSDPVAVNGMSRQTQTNAIPAARAFFFFDVFIIHTLYFLREETIDREVIPECSPVLKYDDDG